MSKALFLDRDGIINIDHGYVHKKEAFEFMPGIFELCQQAQRQGFLIIVITNQAGIARGYYNEAAFEELTSWMKAKFAEQDVEITDVFYCPHHPEKGKGTYLQHCRCRKPEPGMILDAQIKHDIELANSVFIGDKDSDIQAAQAAGIPNRILVSGKYAIAQGIAAHKVDDLQQAAKYLR